MQWTKRSYRMYKKIWKRGQCPHCRHEVTMCNTKIESDYIEHIMVEAVERCGNCGCFLAEMSYGPWFTWWDHVQYAQSLKKREERSVMK